MTNPSLGMFSACPAPLTSFPIPGPEPVVLFAVVMTCCRSYGDVCCWGLVSIAEADVDIVLNSSDHLNTSGASQGTGGQRRSCPFPVFGV